MNVVHVWLMTQGELNCAQGRDAKARVTKLVEVLDRYTPDVLLAFFADDGWK
jgi:LmbE family N-acetylglucosaminyl deacetylase